MNIFIDAKTKMGDTYLICRSILGESLLERHILLAKKLGANKVVFNIPLEEKEKVSKLVSKHFRERQYSFEALNPENYDLKLDIGCVYNIDGAAKDYLDDKSLNNSIIWKIKDECDIKSAEDEYARTKWFPIGRYYIVPIAKFIASRLSKTDVSANQLTFISFIVGLVAAALILTGNRVLLGISGVLYLVFWLLDIADGKLARLKGEVSDFGKWFDPVVGEVIDYLLYLAVVYSIYISSHNPMILWIGIFYFIGKHITLYLMHTGTSVFKDKCKENENAFSAGASSPYSRVAHFIHDADIRKHFMAFALIFNIAIVPLVFYAVYYNVWSLSKCALEYNRYRKNK